MKFRKSNPEAFSRTKMLCLAGLFAVFYSTITFGQTAAYSDEAIRSYTKAVQIMAENFQPSYHENGDTLIVAKIPTPVDSINHFLYYCLSHKIQAVDKFAYLIILKLQKEYWKVNRSDYDFCYYSKNGIVDLVRDRLNVAYDEIGCSFFKTHDVYVWVKKNKQSFKSYLPLIKELQTIDKLLN